MEPDTIQLLVVVEAVLVLLVKTDKIHIHLLILILVVVMVALVKLIQLLTEQLQFTTLVGVEVLKVMLDQVYLYLKHVLQVLVLKVEEQMVIEVVQQLLLKQIKVVDQVVQEPLMLQAQAEKVLLF